MNKPKFFITDVFTDKKYGGNPLATFVDCESLSDQEMQAIAKEINFSETTFITSREPRAGGYDVRVFTPKAEVEFAGHPTLGTAHIIRSKILQHPIKELVLNLRVGKIPVTFVDKDDGASTLWMRQMAPKFGQRLDATRLTKVLGLGGSDIDASAPIEEVSTGFPHLVVPLTGLAALARAKIDGDEYSALVKETWAKIILVFSCEGYDTSQSVSVRVFADFFGIPEDAATGSGNGALAAYLSRYQLLGSSRVDLLVGQGYEMGRPSTLALRADDSQGEISVFVGGRVVDVAAGVWG